MKSLEGILGRLALAFFALFGVLALFNVGTLLMRGPAERPAPPVSAQAETPAATADAPAATTAPAATAEASAAPAAEPAAPAETASAAPAAPPAEVAAVVPASADAAAGEAVFKKCTACHSVEKDGAKKTGPNLWGIVGANVAHLADFKYSDAMANHGGTWTPELLDAYLAKPKDAIPGNKMSFAGLPKPEDRANLIAFLATQSDNPAPVAAAVPTPGDAPAAVEAAAAAPADAAAVSAADAAAEPAAPEIAQIPHVDPAPLTEAQQAEIAQRVAAIEAELPALDYERARHHPIHYPPMIDTAADGECLVCHKDINDHTPRTESPAGLRADLALAWYQTLDTYVPQEGIGQSDFHWRHSQGPMAEQTMNMSCNFCHRGNDPREESPDMMPLRAAFSADPKKPEFTLRKMVNPSETCLLCHGAMPDPVNIMGLGGHWTEVRADMEDQTSNDPMVANGCLSCHGELFRTNRHNVTYLKAASIEDLAQAGSDTCYGCHGGRAWYNISYPYARQPWPGMDTETVPEWAVDRPTEVDPRWAMPALDPASVPPASN